MGPVTAVEVVGGPSHQHRTGRRGGQHVVQSRQAPLGAFRRVLEAIDPLHWASPAISCGRRRTGARFTGDRHQPVALVVVEWTCSYSYSFCHTTTVTGAVVDTATGRRVDHDRQIGLKVPMAVALTDTEGRCCSGRATDGAARRRHPPEEKGGVPISHGEPEISTFRRRPTLLEHLVTMQAS